MIVLGASILTSVRFAITVRQLSCGVLVAGSWLLNATPAAAQVGVTIRQAVTQALAAEPGIDAADAERAAAAATLDLARQAYWPRADALMQVNRATHNNVAGLLLPQSVISPISGPVSSGDASSNVWGTAVGALVTWEPFDFGARRSSIEAARFGSQRAGLAWERTRLATAALVADAYLTVLASQQTVAAAQSAVTRAESLVTTIDALVRAEIRPGVDLSSMRAERAAAAIQVIQAQRAADAALALLRRYAGPTATPITAPLPQAGPAAAPQQGNTAPPLTASYPSPSHPALLERQAAIDESAARLATARHSADPRVAVQGTVFGRGTGILDDNTAGRGADGLGLDAYNWATGVTLAVPLTDWLHRPAREALERARIKAATASREQTVRDLARQLTLAEQDVSAAAALSRELPAVVEAARAAHDQATARYQAGLSSITDVADAQRRLSQAEIDAAIVELNAWRARLAVAALTSSSADDFMRALPGTP